MTTETQIHQAQETETQPKTVVYPLVDVFENDGEFLLVADLPGITKDALDITVNGDTIELKAETETLEDRRSFALGDDV
ncbi:MAG: Hsp20/alpha crystallin family protein, partial [Myxococcales bacterium]|nr:Hsp20/alpha crystallin family protein [Myxococcales bacterium]